MIQKFRFGEPILSDSVVKDIPLSKGNVPYVQTKSEENLSFHYDLAPEDAVYGLGENMHGINKRGFVYESRCMDGARHTDDRISLYAAHNFIIVDGNRRFAMFLDTASIVTYDVGNKNIDQLIITCKTKDVDVYIIEEKDLVSIVSAFRELIGKSYIPPKWAFGYQQSRWGYRTEDDFREIAKNYKEHGIPLDALYMDIDYMEEYESFTIDREKFPNFEGLVDEMKADGLHLVPIIDAGIKVKQGYGVYEDGVANDYFCKDKDGNNFKCGVWPGFCHFPDVLNTKTRAWFGDQYRVLLDKGIDGFWNDMNEPSIFYTQERLQEAYTMVDELRAQGELDLHTYFGLRSKFQTLTSNPEDYKLFYHDMDGKKVRHDAVHNLFGYYLTRAAAEGFDRYNSEKRILLFSRASSIGMHRYSGIWTGDNHSWWSHLKMNIKMMPSLNMCGFLYSGADLGGFGGDTNEELMLRWIEFGMFAPLMRNHNQGRRDQELYTFSHTNWFKNLIELRYAMIPYLYSEFVKAVQTNACFFRPLVFDYTKDPMVKEIEDQLMVGEGIMVAPIYEANVRGRTVYVPEDMLMVRMRSYEEIQTETIAKGMHYVSMALDEVVFFIKKDHLMVLAEPKTRTRDMNFDQLYVLGYITQPIQYQLYDDDGYSKQYDQPDNLHVVYATSTEVSCASKQVQFLKS